MARITAHELIDPHGPLELVLFPGTQSNVFEVRVEGWLNRAYGDSRIPSSASETTKNQLARALALHFAYTAVVQRMAAQPLTVTTAEKGSSGYSVDQIKLMQARADQYLVEFSDLLPVPTFDPLPGSGSVRTFITP